MVDEKLNQKVRELLEGQVKSGRQIGTQVAAYRYGKLLVDAWAGTMGPRDPRPVQADTLFPSFSTTKGVAATALHVLADRGVIDYEAPVAKYWPAFAQNGKERITVSQAMSHQAGLHAMPRPMRADFVCDWSAGLRWMEESAPAWEPGTATGYHAITWAWIAGGIIQYASGRHVSEVVEEEIARPLGVSGDMYIGVPAGVEPRLASLLEAGPVVEAAAAQRAGVTPDSDFARAMPTDHDFSWNDMRLRQACVPSANGHFTARALARMYGALANGGEIDGVRLVTPERVREMQRIVTNAPDRVLLGWPLRKGIGYFMGGKTNGVHGAMGPRETAFGHPGAGGSVAFADPEVGLSIAVTINRMYQEMVDPGPDPAFEVCELIRNELGVNG
ncbi:MAG TPA: serine hydrolase domain-containing protein [Dehalococcoidia bacterium]|nr:serine hydrolase domain-containing protein [Dehalococcoidia bacterium]